MQRRRSTLHCANAANRSEYMLNSLFKRKYKKDFLKGNDENKAFKNKRKHKTTGKNVAVVPLHKLTLPLTYSVTS